MELLITENKSKSLKDLLHFPQTTRVFLQRDYTYGLFINENYLYYDVLTETQREEYFKYPDKGSLTYEITYEQGELVLQAGKTPFNKQKIYKEDIKKIDWEPEEEISSISDIVEQVRKELHK